MFLSSCNSDGLYWGGSDVFAKARGWGSPVSITPSITKESGPQKINVHVWCLGMMSASFYDRFVMCVVRANGAVLSPLCRNR